MHHALPSHDYEIVNNVLVIYDLNKSGRALANNIDVVLKTVISELGDAPNSVLYRDSGRTFDGVLHDAGQFRGFYAINETVLEAALSKAVLHDTLH